MKKFPINLSNFKKVSSDKSSTTMQSPEGHKITIAHNGVSPKMREQLALLPLAMADGGEVPNAQESPPPVIVNVNGGQPVAPNNAPMNPNMPMMNPEMPQVAEAPQAVPAQQMKSPAQMPSAPMPSAPPVNAPATPNDPYGTQALQQSTLQGLQEQKSGILGQAGAEAAGGAAQARLLQQQAQQQKMMADEFQANLHGLNQDYSKIREAIDKQEIDPQRFLKNMTGGQKVMTAIGLILGGIGAGLGHRENPAMQFLNRQIDDDINAQRAELGKKENLLGANLRQYGNMRDATDMTRVMYNDMVSNQLKAAAARTTDPIAKARALQEIGKIDQANAPILSQIAMRKTLLNGASTGRLNPEQVIHAIVPPQEKEHVFKELREAQDMGKARDNTLRIFDQIASINTLGNRIMSPVQSAKQVAALKNATTAQLAKDTAGKLTEADMQAIGELFPAVGDDSRTAQIKRSRLAELITEKMNFPRLKEYGINLGAGGSGIKEAAPVLTK